jgi:hypothetical protein
VYVDTGDFFGDAIKGVEEVDDDGDEDEDVEARDEDDGDEFLMAAACF